MIDFNLIEDDSEKIEIIRSIGDLIENGEIAPEKLNECLANYFSMSSYLTSFLEYQEKVCHNLKLDYKIWESEKMVETKLKMSVDLPKSVKLAQTEIEQQMIVDNRLEYIEWKHKIEDEERKEGFYRRLCDTMKQQSQMLINISQNMRSELKALATEKKANEDISEECIGRRVPMRKPL